MVEGLNYSGKSVSVQPVLDLEAQCCIIICREKIMEKSGNFKSDLQWEPFYYLCYTLSKFSCKIIEIEI